MSEQRPAIPTDLEHDGADTKARLTEAKVRQIIGLLAEGRVRSEIAKQFGVGDTTIRRIANGEAWKQVLRPTNFANTVRHSTAKLTEAQVRQIRRLLKAGRTQQAVAREFKVGQSTISDIATGRNWSWLSHD